MTAGGAGPVALATTEAARIMPERRISAWPVVAGDRLVGIVTGTDPMRFLVTPSGTQDRDVTD